MKKIFSLKRLASGYLHDSPRWDNFYCYQTQHWTVLCAGLGVAPTQLFFYENKVGHIFVPKFYHDKRGTNFLKFLLYIGEYGPDISPALWIWKKDQQQKNAIIYKNYDGKNINYDGKNMLSSIRLMTAKFDWLIWPNMLLLKW